MCFFYPLFRPQKVVFQHPGGGGGGGGGGVGLVRGINNAKLRDGAQPHIIQPLEPSTQHINSSVKRGGKDRDGV
jgi:hypothetical protein